MNALSEARTLGDVLRANALARPNKVAFATLESRSVTFGAFHHRVNRLNNAAAALGLAKGARVAILSKNRPEYVEAYGMAGSGLIVVPLNWRLAAGELAKLIRHSAPQMLIVDAHHRALVETMRKDLPSVRHFVLLGQAGAGWIAYEDLLAGAQASEPADRAQPDDTMCLIYTSGTTGAPKGVALTHAGVLGNGRTAAGEMLGLTEHDVTMAVMPLFHVGGMWYHLFPSFASGCTTLILADFEPQTILGELAARRITNVHLVPTMIGALLAEPSSRMADLSGVRLLFYAGSSMPAELLRRAMQTFSHCGFAQAYGSTEAGVVTVLGPEAHCRAREPDGEHLLSSCGRPFAGRALRVVDEAGHEVAAGTAGEIEVRSPDTMKGYWHDDEATRQALNEGWLKTGDLGRLDAEGFLYIVDRKSDMIVTGGENVFPSEVEEHLYRDPDVQEAAVFGLPDPHWVEKVVAAVVLQPGARVSGGELMERLRRRLAPYKCPKEIFFTASLPKSAIGKVLRKELRKQYGTSM